MPFSVALSDLHGTRSASSSAQEREGGPLSRRHVWHIKEGGEKILRGDVKECGAC